MNRCQVPGVGCQPRPVTAWKPRHLTPGTWHPTPGTYDPPLEHREIIPSGRRAAVRAAPDLARRRSRRLRDDHGTVGRGEIHAARGARDARRRLDRRVPAARPRGPHAEAQGPHRAGQTVRGVRVPAVSPDRRPHRRREPRDAAVVPRREARRSRGRGGGYARPFRYGREKESLSPPALWRPAATRGGRAGGDSPTGVAARRRTDRESSFESGEGHHGAVPRAERRRDDDRAGDALGRQREVRKARDPAERWLGGELTWTRFSKTSATLCARCGTAPASQSWSCSPWRSASAPTPRSSAWWTRCCSGRCPIPTRTAWCRSTRRCRDRARTSTEWRCPTPTFSSCRHSPRISPVWLRIRTHGT